VLTSVPKRVGVEGSSVLPLKSFSHASVVVSDLEKAPDGNMVEFLGPTRKRA